MLIKNLPPRNKRLNRDASAPRSTFLKENVMTQGINQTTNLTHIGKIITTSQIIEKIKPHPPVQLIPKIKHVYFSEATHVTYIATDNSDNSNAAMEALHKLLTNTTFDYHNLSVTKKDIMLEKEIGIIVMMELIDAESKKECEPFSTIEEIGSRENSDETRKEYQISQSDTTAKTNGTTVFSNKWVDEWDCLTKNQESIVYTKVAEVSTTRSLYQTVKPAAEKKLTIPTHQKKKTFLVEPIKNNLMSVKREISRPRGKPTLVDQLMVSYEKMRKGINVNNLNK